MSDIKAYIKKARPALSESSITTYASILKNLYIRVYGDEIVDLDKFKNPDKTLKFLLDIPCNRRKTILSALVIITDNKHYRDLMAEDVKQYNAEIQKQEKTPTQEDAWVTSQDIQNIFNDLKKTADLLYKKKDLSNIDLQDIQNFIILAVLGGIFLAPRRLKDFVDFKIKDVDKNVDNYVDKNTLVFNSYKTSKTYGKQIIAIPAELKKILTKWIKINPTDFLIFDSNRNKLSSVKLNQRFNKIFGKATSVNALRHSYLTEKYADNSKKNKALENDMSAMGSSKSMADTYIKLD